MKKLSENIKSALNIIGPMKKSAFMVLFTSMFSAVMASFGLVLILPILQVVIEGRMHGKMRFILEPIVSRFPKEYLLLVLCGIFLAIMSMKFFSALLRVFIAKKFIWNLRLQWVDQVFKKYMRSEYFFILNHKQGELLNNLIGETHRGAIWISKSIEFLSNMILFFALTCTLLFVNWKATVLMFSVLGFFLLITNKLSRRFADKIGRKRIKLSQEMSAWGVESIGAIRQVKTFGLEGIFSQQNKRIAGQLRDIQIKFDLARAFYLPFNEFLLTSFLVIMLIAINSLPGISLKSLFPILGIMVLIGQRLISNISRLASLRLQIIGLFPAIKLTHKLISDEIKEEVLKEGKKFNGLKKDIIFNDVSFGYGKVKVFGKLNLVIPYGKTTAVIGPSGIGKSTLADLLLRLYDPDSGKIMINDIDIKEWDLRNWRKNIGFVSQDTFVFNRSVKDNILLGDLNADEEKVIDSAKKAHAHDFIQKLPQGYDTVIGDRGLKLSGGQRQRIAIARAIIRDPDFFIFDEATSSLDNESEKKVQMAIDELGKRKTVLVIAHRLTTIENADRVYDFGELIKVSP